MSGTCQFTKHNSIRETIDKVLMIRVYNGLYFNANCLNILKGYENLGVLAFLIVYSDEGGLKKMLLFRKIFIVFT